MFPYMQIFFCIVLISLEMGASEGKPFGNDAARVISKDIKNAGEEFETATFAGGCFWGLQLAYQRVPGVISSKVGYTQGYTKDPTYEEVCSGRSGHAEAVQVVFDQTTVAYEELLVILWDRIDPTTLNRQGNDRGTQYRSGIYYHNDKQKELALKSLRNEQSKYSEPIVTEVAAAVEFFDAEPYHQNYLENGGQCAAKGDLSNIRCYG